MTARLFGVDDLLDSDAWYTPQWIFDGLGLAFDLDVAAPAERLEWIPARERYTVADDGLGLPWHGLVWCNPPYSDPLPWCARWAEHADGVLLIRADLSTRAGFAAFSAADAMHVPAKRIQFVNGHGGSTTAANFTSVLLARGSAAVAGVVRLAERTCGVTRHMVPPA